VSLNLCDELIVERPDIDALRNEAPYVVRSLRIMGRFVNPSVGANLPQISDCRRDQ
jgi:hypothetical protein